MNSTILAAMLDALNADAVLVGYLGGARVFRGWINKDTVIPCVTITESNESSMSYAGYNASGHRKMRPGIQVDTWISKSHEGFPCNGDDLDVIANYVDWFIFHTGFTNTKEWERITTSEQYESDTLLFHKAMRYNFTYNQVD